MEQKRNRFLAAIVGAQRSGKSHLVNNFAASQYIQKRFPVLVYNWSGQPHDFPNYYEITPLGEESIEMLPPALLDELRYNATDILYTAKTPNGEDVKTPNGKLKVFSFKFFNKDFYGKGVRMLAMDSAAPFFKNIDAYVSNALVVIDDAKPVVSHGLGDEGLKLTRRLNHAGGRHVSKAYKSKGVDCIFIFHDIDDIRTGIYSSLNYLILFKTTSKPNTSPAQIPNPEAAKQIAEAWQKLQTMPKYSHIQIDYSPI